MADDGAKKKKGGKDGDDIFFLKSEEFYRASKPKCIRHGAGGSYGFQVAIVNLTHLTGLWRLVERGAAIREGHANIAGRG